MAKRKIAIEVGVGVICLWAAIGLGHAVTIGSQPLAMACALVWVVLAMLSGYRAGRAEQAEPA